MVRRTSSSVGSPGQRFGGVRPATVGMFPRGDAPSCSSSAIRTLAHVLRSSKSLSSFPCISWLCGTFRYACLTSCTTSMTSLKTPLRAAIASCGVGVSVDVRAPFTKTREVTLQGVYPVLSPPSPPTSSTSTTRIGTTTRRGHLALDESEELLSAQEARSVHLSVSSDPYRGIDGQRERRRLLR